MRQGMRRWPAIWGAALLLLASLMFSACAGSGSNNLKIPTATAAAVQIKTDRTAYTTAQPIGVTISNTGSQGFYAVTGRSACTFLQLQKYDTTKRAWFATVGCDTAYQPQALLISANMTEPFTLPPGNASDNPNVWVPGAYRIALQYGTQSDGSGNVQVAYSAGFQIT
ncbi:MAG: hypothetical protein OJF49_001424 [Ktedonobacterales bacterium]|jgi:hypothetical protein|nr:MAG: hypothetical protein OJF49_001424 [Ktedonobacterales bacterium]